MRICSYFELIMLLMLLLLENVTVDVISVFDAGQFLMLILL